MMIKSNEFNHETGWLSKKIIILNLHLFAIVVFALSVPILENSFSNEFRINVTSVFFTILSAWCIWTWRTIYHGLFNPYILFLIAAVIFNGGQAFLEVLGLNGVTGMLGGRFTSDILFTTLALVILGIASFHFGGLVALATTNQVKREENLEKKELYAHSGRLVSVLILAISVVPALLLIREAIDTVLVSGYFALYTQQVGTGFEAAPQVLATFLVPGAFFLLVGSEKRLPYVLISLGMVLAYSTIMLFLGRRGNAIPVLITYSWLWHRTIRPLPRGFLLIVAAIGLFIVIPLLGVIRNTPGAERLSVPQLVDSYLSIDNPTVAAVSEMGGSMMTIAYTVDLVPSSRQFDNGLGYLYATLTVFPNFFWDIHPSIAHGTASSWLINTVNPYTAAHGGGYGYSFIAEAYLNFGWFGTVITLAVIGFLFARIVLWADNGDPIRLATVGTFLVFFLFYARAEAAQIIRPLVWYSFFPYFLIRFASRFVDRLKKRYERVPISS